MPDRVARLPDFIIIGAMKCATSTLHEQLARQPGMVMSSPKEPNFFSDDDQWRRGLDWYQNLFASAGALDLCGESSTHYTKLPTYPRTVERMRTHLPSSVKLIYIMRHPIERLVSQYIHEWTQRVVNESIDAAIDNHPELIAYSRYAMQLQPYIDAWGFENILPLFFERFTSHPKETLERVCRFIGYANQPQWDETAGAQNVSKARLRRSRWRDAVLDLPAVAALRRALVPRSIRERVKGLWQMKERPEISRAHESRLRQIFDADLAILGEWLGVTGLSCETFHAAAARGQPAWRGSAEASSA